MTDTNPTPGAGEGSDPAGSDPAGPDPAGPDPAGPRDAVLDDHAEQLARHESWLSELETSIGDRLSRLEAKVGATPRKGYLDEPEVPASMAATEEGGPQQGHAGPGTGDGPATPS